MTMSNAFVPGAESAPAAAPTAPVQTPAGGVGQVPGGAPTAADAPQAGQPTQPVAPQFDPQEVERLRQQASFGQQLAGELQRFAADQERARAVQQQVDAVQQQRQTIYRLAENMPPAEAFQFIQAQEMDLQNKVLMTQRQQEMSARQQEQANQQALLDHLAAPQYAETILQKHGLPAEYKTLLAGISPRRMEEYIPIIKQEHAKTQGIQQQLNDLQAQLSQVNRSGAAQQLQQNGAHIPSGGNATPIPTDGEYVKDGSNNHLRAVLARNGYSVQ